MKQKNLAGQFNTSRNQGMNRKRLKCSLKFVKSNHHTCQFTEQNQFPKHNLSKKTEGVRLRKLRAVDFVRVIELNVFLINLSFLTAFYLNQQRPELVVES
jgi:hypothetical protein